MRDRYFRKPFVGLVLFLLFHSFSFAETTQDNLDLDYSGKIEWNVEKATLHFLTSGAMPNSKEGFYWNVPAYVKKIAIEENVTVQGGFRIRSRAEDNPMEIVGKNSRTSIIHGTDEQKWTTENNVPDLLKGMYGSVNVMGNATVHVKNLTSLNPRSYHISGYGLRSVIHVKDCRLIDSRPGDNNNSDGFIGADGSSIVDTFISTGDDGIKAYNDMLIENVTIEQHRNGAPIQLGWGPRPKDKVSVSIRNLKIYGVDKEKRYNMAPFSWEAGVKARTDIVVDGLDVKMDGKIFVKETNDWRPIGLFQLNPKECELNMTITSGRIEPLDFGIRKTKGEIKLNENVVAIPANKYT